MRTLKVVPATRSVNLHDADNNDLVAIGAPPHLDNGDMAEIAKRWNVHEALVTALDLIAHSACCQTPGCCTDDPKCDTMTARAALAQLKEDK